MYANILWDSIDAAMQLDDQALAGLQRSEGVGGVMGFIAILRECVNK